MARKKDPTKQWKNLEIDKDAIKIISKRAIDEGTDFKNLSEKVLEDYANNKIISKLQSDSLTKCADEALKSKLTIKK